MREYAIIRSHNKELGFKSKDSAIFGFKIAASKQ